MYNVYNANISVTRMLLSYSVMLLGLVYVLIV